MKISKYVFPLLLTITGCSTTPPQEIMGKWRIYDVENLNDGEFISTKIRYPAFYIAFNADGSFESADSVHTQKGTWSFAKRGNESKIIVQSVEDQKPLNTTFYLEELNKNHMTLRIELSELKIRFQLEPY